MEPDEIDAALDGAEELGKVLDDLEARSRSFGSALTSALKGAVLDGDSLIEVLQNIARWGKGRFYQTSDPHDVPQIFTKETMTASKSSLVEEPFLPQVLRNDQVVRGIDWNNAPFLFGYVVTVPKPTAGVPLLTERGDPLLVSWQFGLGKSAAFMSDATSKWGADWVRWAGYGQFWAQLVRDVMRTTQHRGAETTLSVQGGEGHLRVDATDESGEFRNGLTTSAQLVKPDLSLVPLALQVLLVSMV